MHLLIHLSMQSFHLFKNTVMSSTNDIVIKLWTELQPDFLVKTTSPNLAWALI